MFRVVIDAVRVLAVDLYVKSSWSMSLTQIFKILYKMYSEVYMYVYVK